MRALAACVALALGCQAEGPGGYAVDLTVTVGRAIADPSQIARVLVEIGGDDSASYSVDHPFGDEGDRAQQLVYHPSAQRGELTFDVDAYDLAGVEVARGNTRVELSPGTTVQALIVLQPRARL
jgi:hypothetical protein